MMRHGMGVRAPRGILFFAAALLAAAARAEHAGPPPGRTLDLPPAWLRFEIVWKQTWEATLAAYPENKWHEELKKYPATAPQVDQISRLRRIELLKAMMKHWPDDRARHRDAYVEIAGTYGKLGWPWWQSWWGYKLAKDFADNPAAVQQGYQMALNWSFGQYTHWGWYGYRMVPESRDWEFTIFEIIDRHKSGKLADGPAVRQAYSYLGWMIADFADYGRVHPFFEDMRKLAKSDPGFGAEVDNVLKQFGHNENVSARGPLSIKSPSAQETQFELETRWEAAQHSDLFQDSATPVDARSMQRLFDLIAEMEASAPDHGDRTPHWSLLDKRLTALPRERLTSLVAAQNEAAMLAARAARMTGDEDELLCAFRRYPFAACLHETMVELAERDVCNGLSQWAVPVLWSVVAHTCDASLRGQAYASLWVALSQNPADHAELARAMLAVPDNTRLTWRGRNVQAGEIKKLLLAQAPSPEDVRKVNLATVIVQRIELPNEWPAREQNRDGPVADYGIHAPWPVSWIDRRGSSLIVGTPKAVARYDAGRQAATWFLNPEKQKFYGAWNIDAGHALYSTWCAGRRPVRPGISGGSPNSRVYCLMNTVGSPVVAAVGVLDGKLEWSSENGAGWDGMEPVSQPAEAEGRLYLLAAQCVEPAAMCLVCLDAQNGRVLWKRGIGEIRAARLDLARGSGRVFIREGRVYCASNAGLLARCGAHDGMVQWVQAYPAAVHRNGGVESINPRREGAGPIIVTPTGAGQTGSVILLAPRDHSGIIAFAHESGKLLWETSLVPSDRLLGTTGSEVVGINENWLTALDLATGRQLYCREFPAGTGSAGIVVGSDVIIVSGGVLHRIQAATGVTIETRDLNTGPESEFTILPDRTVVQIVPPPLVTLPGPSTAGRKITLPLEKVWSVECDSPVLLLREDRTRGLDRFGFITGRRVASVARDPNWRVMWEGLLPRPPQTAGFTGNNLVTLDQWTLTARNADDGKIRWSSATPFAAAGVAGDERFTYVKGGHPSVGLTLAVLDSVGGELKWTRCLGRETFGDCKATLLRSEPDGSRVLRALARYLDPATGAWRFGDVRIDPASGKILGAQPVMGDGESSWSTVDYDEKGFAFFMFRGASYWGFGEQLHVALDYEGKRLTDNWKRRFDLWDLNKDLCGRAGMHVRGHGVYTKLNWYLLFYDPATGQEIRYDIARQGEDGPRPPPEIFDFREEGDRLIVVSGWINSKMYVDIFERATGKSLGRQELPGVLLQARIDETAIIVTACDGVHVFASAVSRGQSSLQP